jgi:ABC-type transport system involved in multi-copper enzyme maturation permease subunit
MIYLLLNNLRRTWRSGLLSCIALFAFQAIICRVFQQIQASGGAGPMARLMPKWAQSLFGIDPQAISALSGVLSIAYQHPFQLAVLFAAPVAAATAFLAGEIEQRSIGLVLARPISRFTVVTAAALICLLWPMLTTMSAFAGTLTGIHYLHITESVDMQQLARVALNLYALAAAIVGIALAVSSMQDQRGDAVGWAVTIVLLMYAWNFLAQLWAASGALPNFSIFRYFSPPSILLRGAAPWHEIKVLAAVAATGVLFSGLVFRFRDITV